MWFTGSLLLFTSSDPPRPLSQTPLTDDFASKGLTGRAEMFVVQYAWWSALSPCPILPPSFSFHSYYSSICILKSVPPSIYLLPRGPNWHSGSGSVWRKQVVRWGLGPGSLTAWLARRTLSQVLCGGTDSLWHKMLAQLQKLSLVNWEVFQCTGLGIWKIQGKIIHTREMELPGCY